MAKRVMLETAAKADGKMNDNYCMSYYEISQLKDMIMQQPFEMDHIYDELLTAFKYGYVLGGRAVSKGAKVL